MIRAAAKIDGGDMVLLGLSERNIQKLKAGMPIKCDWRSVGQDKEGGMSLFYGRTESEMEDMLKQSGMIGEETASTASARLDQDNAILTRHARVLICTVGLPRSGKSTWAKGEAWPVVNPDSIRLALHGQRFASEAEPFVWAIAKTMVRSLFLAGHQVVIVDATNTTRKRRDEWVSKEWFTCFHEISASPETCRERAAGDESLLPVIERMAAAWEPLSTDEPRWI